MGLTKDDCGELMDCIEARVRSERGSRPGEHRLGEDVGARRPVEPRLATSDPQEQLAAIHPEEDEPEHQEDGHALEKGRVGSTQEIEDVPAEVRLEAVADETFDQVAEAVRGNRVGVDDPQGKRPEPSAQPVDVREKRKQMPPEKRTQLGVQIRFTTGQMSSSPRPQPSARLMVPATRSQANWNQGGRSRFKMPPAISPRIIVASVGMKLSVA